MSKEKETRTFTRRYANEYHIFRWFFQIFAVAVSLPYFLWSYQISVKGRENLPKGTNYIYSANHVSMFDPLMVSYAVFRPIAYMAKKELFDINCNLNWWIKRLGAFSVNREKVEISTFKTVKDIFKTNWNLGIFPQGQIVDEKKIAKVQKGFAVIAQKAKADIVPIAIKGFNGYTKTFHAQKIELIIGKPISYKLSPEEITLQWADFICKNTGFENCMHGCDENNTQEENSLNKEEAQVSA